MKPEARTLVALDTPDPAKARELARVLAGRVGGFKIGLTAFVACGPPLVREMRQLGHIVFLDLKFHDIPNTVAGAVAAAAPLNIQFFTVHALGGSAMLAAAAKAAVEATPPGSTPPVVLAVTILTSHDDGSLDELGIDGPCAGAVPRLAALAKKAGAGGIVCSPLEVASARAAFPGGVIVVPGIRLDGRSDARKDDQARVAGPGRTVRAGADRIVVGRPITEAADPAAVAEAIAEDIRRHADG